MGFDDSGFDDLFLPHLGAAFNLARHLARDEELAEDIVQDAYLRALRHARAFRGENPRAWLLTIVRRTFYSQWQRDRGAGVTESFDELSHSDAREESGPDASLSRSLAHARVEHALGTLPAPYREVLVLRELEGFSYDEIGRIIGVPVGTVMSRLSRARTRLRTALGPGEEERGDAG